MLTRAIDVIVLACLIASLVAWPSPANACTDSGSPPPVNQYCADGGMEVTCTSDGDCSLYAHGTTCVSSTCSCRPTSVVLPSCLDQDLCSGTTWAECPDAGAGPVDAGDGGEPDAGLGGESDGAASGGCSVGPMAGGGSPAWGFFAVGLISLPWLRRRRADSPDRGRRQLPLGLRLVCLMALSGVAGCDGGIATSNDGGFARDGSGDAAGDVAHRAAPTPCSSDPPPPGDVNLEAGALVPDPMNPYADAGVPPGCHNDGECDAGMNGRCRWTHEVFSSDGGGQPLPKCTYDQCFSDQDCPSPLVCDCRGADVYHLWPSNQCLPSGDCRVDSDCASGLCSPSPNDGCALGFFCHTTLDKCTSDGDCPAGQRCSIPMGDAYWHCLMGCFDAGTN